MYTDCFTPDAEAKLLVGFEQEADVKEHMS